MKLSPLQLSMYFLTNVRVVVNTQFDQSKPLAFDDKDLLVEHECKSMSEGKRSWHVTLRLNHQPPNEANSPYLFSVDLVGFFSVVESYPEANVINLVQTNGPSVLYGIAREIVRDLTARGPYFPIMLPTASFYQGTPKKADAPETAKEAVAPTPPKESV